jgi:putative aldouronate transport system permease protein
MKIKRSAGDIVFDVFIYTFFTVFCITIIVPFLRIITFSLSSDIAISKAGFHLFPSELFLENWKTILTSPMVWSAFGNTILITVMAMVYQLLLSTTFAYSLSRRELPNRNMWTMILLITMFFGGGLIPTYMLIRQLGLMNSRFALILGGISAWNVLIIRNFFMSVPDSIMDSARIDGANDIQVFYKIMLPLSKPVLATITLWLLVGNWNSWYSCMLYINDQSKIVLQIMLRQIIIENSVNISDIQGSIRRIEQGMSATGGKYVPPSVEGLKNAALMFVTLPILCSYPFLQKYLIKGILIGSLKG